MLNALRRQRFWHQGVQNQGGQPGGVLNALRRQRFWHSALEENSLEMDKVLNALRRQRFWHIPPTRPASLAIMCLTPYGVRGFGILAELIGYSPRTVVLNALRRQRFWH